MEGPPEGPPVGILLLLPSFKSDQLSIWNMSIQLQYVLDKGLTEGMVA